MIEIDPNLGEIILNSFHDKGKYLSKRYLKNMILIIDNSTEDICLKKQFSGKCYISENFICECKRCGIIDMNELFDIIL